MRRQEGGPEGILLVDKPAGWTSHDVVAKVRRLAGQRRAGHTGTLDPAATGLLVLCLGRATRLVEYMTADAKEYEGTIALGVTTDTDDAEGTVTAERPVPEVTPEQLGSLERRFSGTILQVPPAFSAVQVQGRRAYAAAREGRPFDLPAREVTVHRLSLEARDGGLLGIRMTCSGGTYVRSIARDIGAALGCGAHLASLRRLRAGPFHVEDAWTIAGLAETLSARPIGDVLLAPDEGLLTYGVALVERPEARDVRIESGRLSPNETTVRMYDAGGTFLGTATVDGARLRPRKVFPPPRAGRGGGEREGRTGPDSAELAPKCGAEIEID
jgi:tRNA pseudouridine55 synthase